MLQCILIYGNRINKLFRQIGTIQPLKKVVKQLE